MTHSQAMWLASVVGVLEVAFLQAGTQLTRRSASPSDDAQGRSTVIAWLAAAIVLLVIPFAAAGVLRLSSAAVTVRAALVTSAGVLVASIAWFVVGRILVARSSQPSDSSWTQLLWQTAGYGLLVVITVRLLLGPGAPVED